LPILGAAGLAIAGAADGIAASMALQVDRVTRRYGSQLALDAVSILVREGDCYGFIGHNGAGKTTAMRIVLGLQRADGGRVIVDGFDAARHPREARARIGGLIETPGFHGMLDGAANLRLLGRLQGLGRSDAAREAERLLDVVGLNAGAKPVAAYSQGMRQRLGIAQALLGKPAYVLLDEPTNGLDPQGIADLRELFRGLSREQGITFLISSHQLHELADLCNRVGVLHRGKLLVESETKALLAGARGGLELETDDDARAAGVLAALGASSRPAAGGGLAVEPGARTAAEISRAIVSSGLALTRFGARSPSLEEIYLRYARGEVVAPSAPPRAGDSTPEPRAPAERRAAPRPVLRVLRYELTRWLARPGPALLLAVPALIGVGAVLLEKRDALADRARVAAGELASATDVTAFQTAALGMKAALPVLALIVAGLGSQMIAAELARGTLRNLLLRPQTRWQVTLGKALAGAALAVAAYVALAAAVLATSSAAFGFRDLVEILPGGQEFPLVPASELWPDLRRAFALPLAPMVASFGLGLLAGSFARGAAGALGLAIALLLALDVARGILRGTAAERWLLSAHSPSPLGDTSYLQFFADRSQGISNAVYTLGEPAALGLAADVLVPAAWIVATLLLSAILLARRSVP
jgi:ABC-type multidrug transport system ATPase subunit